MNFGQGEKSETSGVHTSLVLHSYFARTLLVLHRTSLVLRLYFIRASKNFEVDEVSFFPP